MAKPHAIVISVIAVIFSLALLSSTASATRPSKTLLIQSFTISTTQRNHNLRLIPRYVTVITEFNEPQFDQSRFRDRANDVLSVVVALLFGVGCGALTAATMYLVWSVFSTRSNEYESDYDDEEYHDIPSKMGYLSVDDKAPKQVV